MEKTDKKSFGHDKYLFPELNVPVTFLRKFAGCAML
jgi:hypothetical protein